MNAFTGRFWESTSELPRTLSPTNPRRPYRLPSNTISANEEKFTLLLTAKEKQLFLDFVNAQSSVNSITAIENFIIGFRFDIRIGIEVMDGDDVF